MAIYQCKLILSVKNKTLLKECFYREGESTGEVLKELEKFDYGKGIWVIYDIDDAEE